MTKIILIMFMCSAVPGNKCVIVPTPLEQFKNTIECNRYGYIYSNEIMNSLSKKFIIKHKVYTKFACEKQQTI